ncbi:hypothetical protein BH23BAC2_BH23BAC2_22540 [soil metagenome]
MKYPLKSLPVLLLMFLIPLITLAQTQDQKQIIDDARKGKAAFIEKDPAISKLFASAEAYVIFPNVGKGAYVIGGAAGNGVLYENGNLTGMAKLLQINVGLQVGGQAYRQVIFFKTEEALNHFKAGNFELSANASAVVLEEGKAASIEFRDGVAVVTMPKAGAMIEASVGGQKFEYEAFN